MPPKAARDVVQVWSACLAQPPATVERLFAALSAKERERAKRFRFDVHRERFVVARGILRSILAEQLETAPREVEIGYEAAGKPVVVGPPQGPRLTFNLSHSDDRAIYAVGVERAIGIDLERVRTLPDADAIARSVCSADEAASLGPPGHRDERLLTYWTCKEAYAKANGAGLAQPLRGIEIELGPGDEARLQRVNGDADEAGRWRLERLSPSPGYLAAIVVKGHDWVLNGVRAIADVAHGAAGAVG